MKEDINVIFFSQDNKEVILPKKATKLSAGFDIASNENDFLLYPNQIKVVSVGFGLKMPHNIFAEIRSRSGLSTKGIVVVNSPGTIDADYDKEIKVILGNFGVDPYHVHKFDRIAQMIFRSVLDIALVSEVESVAPFEERVGGFGSTGK
jgi:dUTP pyrophosphatase